MATSCFTRLNCRILFTFLLLCYVCDCSQLVPSEMIHRRLIYMEDELISVSSLLIRAERLSHDGEDNHNLTQIKSFIETARAINDHALEKMAHYTTHPIGIYILTKRLVNEWREKLDLIKQHKLCINDLYTKLENIVSTMPNEKDLEESMNNILRLQQIYHLKTSDLAQGRIQENMTEPLSIEDCYEMAGFAADRLDYFHALEWYRHVVNLCDENPEFKDRQLATWLKMGGVYYKVKDFELAMEYTEKVLKADPQNKAAIRMMTFYESLKKSWGKKLELVSPEPENKLDRMYEGVCSGRITKKSSVTAHPEYRCFLQAVYKYGMVFNKVEVVHRNPNILYFHNFLDKRFNKKLLYALGDKLEESVIRDEGYTNERHWAVISDETRSGSKLNKIFSKLTNIDYKRSRSSFIAFNFVAGVTDGPFADIDTIKSHGRNSTTFIVFLNDVSYGGDTVFPWLKLRIKPEKGGALFFYNTKPSGMVDKKLLWGECPVILGRKWVAHKIFTEMPNDPPKHGNLLADLWNA